MQREQIIPELTKINYQKKLWYKLSILVLFVIIFIIFEYNFIIDKNLEKYFLFFGLTLSASWWFWTMKVLSTLIKIKTVQMEILNQIIQNIKQINSNNH